MPFPYAYYKEEYNGPLHATELQAPLLLLKSAKGIAAADVVGGSLDVTGFSVFSASTIAGGITINQFTGGVDGQVILIRKATSANSLTLTYNSGNPGELVTAPKEDLVFGNGRYGGALFYRQGTSWYHIDNVGFNPDGTVTSPGIAFSSDPDTGIYKPTNNVLGFVTAGVERLAIGSGVITSTLPVRFPLGSVSAPSINFDGDSDTGFYKTASAIAMTHDGIKKIEFFKTGSIGMESPYFRADLPYEFTTSSSTVPQQVRMGSLLVSDVLGDNALLPVNGIYSKGHVKTAGQFQGVATSAQFADLAEMYESDAVYPAGTIVRIGGEKEITVANLSDCFAVISTSPGFLLNAVDKDGIHLPVALTGRVPCRVVGKVVKGAPIFSVGDGTGSMSGSGERIGKALEEKDTEEEGLVMIVTRALI